MKKLATLVFAFLFIGIISNAATNNSEVSEFFNYNPYGGSAYIFEEGGVEFSVFTDGQFDFAYVGQNYIQQVHVNGNSANVNISFNAGHDYEMYVQYDDYGAVIQIENVPVYYDSYGRIIQAGNVDIRYNNQRIVKVGGLFINYNHYGHYVGSTGFINVYNQFYVYRPWHSYYVAPFYSSCIVYDYPYRRYYRPIRYSFGHHSNYYNNRQHVAYQNARRNFNRPGSRLHYEDGRTERNNNYNPNRRNTMISESGLRENATLEKPKTRNEKIDRNRSRLAAKNRPLSTVETVRSSSASSITKWRPSASNGTLERNNPRTINKGKPEMSYTKTSKTTTSSRYKSQDRTQTSSKSNTAIPRDRNSNSQGTSSKRGRGL